MALPARVFLSYLQWRSLAELTEHGQLYFLTVTMDEKRVVAIHTLGRSLETRYRSQG
jgi:hypothetical protein